MSFITLGSFKGSHLIIDIEKYQQRLAEHPATDDRFIHVVGGIVKNAEGKIYLHHHARLNEFMLPGGKVDKGEIFEDAMKRELHEELDIIVHTCHHLSSIKYIVGGLKRCFHMYMIDDYSGIPLNNEYKKYDQYRAEIIQSDNSLGFAVKVDGTITNDVQDIMQSFLDIYHLYTIVPQLHDDGLIRSEYADYDQSMIDPSKHYYLYRDQENKVYYFNDVG